MGLCIMVQRFIVDRDRIHQIAWSSSEAESVTDSLGFDAFGPTDFELIPNSTWVTRYAFMPSARCTAFQTNSVRPPS